MEASNENLAAKSMALHRGMPLTILKGSMCVVPWTTAIGVYFNTALLAKQSRDSSDFQLSGTLISLLFNIYPRNSFVIIEKHVQCSN